MRDKFSNRYFRKIPKNIVNKLKNYNIDGNFKIMEVCGTHTVSIHRYGIHNLLPENISLVSGPGCPVCVTPDIYIDKACFLSKNGYIIATFGDMIKVPGISSSLENERSKGADIRIVYSPLDALKIAQETNKQVVFLAVGFETTVPGIAYSIKSGYERELKNFKILSGNKIVPPALKTLISIKNNIDGFLLPGHVSTVLGRVGYNFMEKDGIPGVIAGFEPSDIITSILKLLDCFKNKTPEIINNYKRVVSEDGNLLSQNIIKEIFDIKDSEWRGIGNIKGSGLELKGKYKNFDVENFIDIKIEKKSKTTNCRCSEVLLGLIDPPECKLFKKVCHPDNPVGPCMVSSEGSCSAWYWYG